MKIRNYKDDTANSCLNDLNSNLVELLLYISLRTKLMEAPFTELQLLIWSVLL